MVRAAVRAWLLIILPVLSGLSCNSIEPKPELSRIIGDELKISVEPPPGIYNRPISIILAAADLQLFYTLDPNAPENQFDLYTGPIELQTAAHLRYYGKQKSRVTAIREAIFDFDFIAPNPSIFPAPGVYATAQSIAINSDDDTAAIYYSLNSNDPVEHFTLYRNPLYLISSAVIRYFAADRLNNRSAVLTASYIIEGDSPTAATDLVWNQKSPFSGLAITAQWKKSISSDLASQEIQLYSDSSCTTPAGSSILVAAETESQQFSVENGKTYTFKILSTDTENHSTPSSCSSTISIDTSAPIPAAALAWAESSPSRFSTATAHWAPSASKDLFAQEILLYSGSSCGSQQQSSPLGATVSEFSISQLTAGTYTFKIRSSDEAGNVSLSSCSAALIIDLTSPFPATALNWAESSPSHLSSATARWSRSGSTDLYSQQILFYSDSTCLIQYQSSPLTTAASEFLITGLGSGTYTFKIKSFDEAGNFSLSSCSTSLVVDSGAPLAATALNWAESSPSRLTTATARWTRSTSADLFSQEILIYSGTSCSTQTQNAVLGATLSEYIVSSLVSGTYSFKIKSSDEAGNYSLSACSEAFIVDLTAPAAATALNWAETSPSRLTTATTRWTRSGSTDLYSQEIYIYSGATCSTQQQSIILTKTASEFTLTGLVSGTYTFKIKSLDEAGNSSLSACSPSFIVDLIAPLAATALNWAETSPSHLTTATARWTRSTSTDLYSQEIFVFLGNSCSTQQQSNILSNSASEFLISGLASGTYTFKIKSSDEAANFTLSTCSPALVVDSGAPVPATALNWAETSPSRLTTATARWTRSSSTDLFSQEIFIYSDATCSAQQQTSALSSTISQFTLSSLTSGTYTFKIKSSDEAGNNSFSLCSEALIVDLTAPLAATNLYWSESSPSRLTTATATWTRSVSTDLYSQEIFLYSGTLCSTQLRTSTLIRAASQFTFSSLTSGVYTFKIKSSDEAGNNSLSACSSPFVVDLATPLPATALNWAEPSPSPLSTAKARWLRSVSTDLYSQEISIYSDSSCSALLQTAALAANPSEFQLSALTSGIYTFKIKSLDEAGNGSLSSCSGPLVVDLIAPLSATGLQWAETSPSRLTTATARWTLSTSTDLASQDILFYAGGNCSGTVTTRHFSSTISETTFSALAEGTYSFLIKSTDQAGNFTDSACSPNFTIDLTAPANATALRWLESSPSPITTITADWIPSITSDLAGQSIRIHSTGGCATGGTDFELSSTARSYVFTGAMNNSYSYQILSRDAAGNQNVSTCSPTMNIGLPPVPDPTNVQGAVFGTTVTLTWTSGGGATSDFRISYQTGSTAPSSCALGTLISESAINETLNTHDLDLSRNTTYSFRVCAIDNSIPPRVSTGTTVTASIGYPINMSVDGKINAIALHPDSDMLWAGEFSSYYPMWAPHLIALQFSGAPDSSFSVLQGFDGTITAMAELSDGGLIVGGDFTHYRGLIANRIAKLTATGLLDTQFSPQIGANGVNQAVYAIAVLDSNIYIGGAFTSYRGALANRIAKINLLGELNQEFNPALSANGTNGDVYALAATDSAIYLGGSFTSYRSTAAGRVARVYPTGLADTVFCAAGAANAAVRAITVAASGDIYIGGSFINYRGSNAYRIAKLNSSGVLNTTFSPQTGSNNGFNGDVLALAVSTTNVFVGGSFDKFLTKPANRIAKLSISGVLDESIFNPATGPNGTNAVVRALALSDTNLFVGGAFGQYRGSRANRLVKLSLTGVQDNTFQSSAGPAGFGSDVRALLNSTSRLYAGGDFTAYSGKPANNLVKISQGGMPDTSFSPATGPNGTNGPIYAIATTSNSVLIGGNFTSYRGNTASYLTELTLTGTPSSNNFEGLDSEVRAITVAGVNIYVGGLFTTYKGATVNRLMRVDPYGYLSTTFSPPTGAVGANGPVYALTWTGPTLYAGGSFTYYRGQIANRIAKIDVSGSLLLDFNPQTGPNGVDAPVEAVAIGGLATNPEIYIGGQFTHYRGATANYVARVDVSGLLNAAFNFGGTINGVNAPVSAISVFDNFIYLGGSFTQYRGETANGFARVTNLGQMSKAFDPETGTGGFGTGAVKAILGSSTENQVYFAGDFIYYREIPTPSFANLDASTGEPKW